MRRTQRYKRWSSHRTGGALTSTTWTPGHWYRPSRPLSWGAASDHHHLAWRNGAPLRWICLPGVIPDPEIARWCYQLWLVVMDSSYWSQLMVANGGYLSGVVNHWWSHSFGGILLITASSTLERQRLIHLKVKTVWQAQLLLVPLLFMATEVPILLAVRIVHYTCQEPKRALLNYFEPALPMINYS